MKEERQNPKNTTIKNMAAKIKPINYTIEELHKLSETPILFLQIIQANKYHLEVFNNDPERDAKVRFIREWYKAKTGQTK